MKILLVEDDDRITDPLAEDLRQVISRSSLLDRLWASDLVSGEQTIKTHLTNLRRKIKQAGADRVKLLY
jgi:two-component system, OmpR family, response regulator QseB